MRLILVLGALALALAGCTVRHHSTSHTPRLDFARLNHDFDALDARAKPGVLGVGLMNLEDGESYALHGERRFPMQSVFKAPMAAAALAEVDAGRLRLGEVVTLEPKDLSPPHSPIGAAFPSRKTYTIAELMTAAVEDSDNTAADVLMKRIGGPGSVSAWLQFKNIHEVRVDRYERQLQPELTGMPSFRPAWKDERAYLAALHAVPPETRAKATANYLADPQDTATPRGMLNFLRQLDDGELLSKGSRDLLLRLMTETNSAPNRLKAGFPRGSILAHKTGTARTDLGMNPATNDVGIVTLPDGRRYAIAVFLSGSTLDDAGRDALIADVARAVARGVR